MPLNRCRSFAGWGKTWLYIDPRKVHVHVIKIISISLIARRHMKSQCVAQVHRMSDIHSVACNDESNITFLTVVCSVIYDVKVNIWFHDIIKSDLNLARPLSIRMNNFQQLFTKKSRWTCWLKIKSPMHPLPANRLCILGRRVHSLNQLQWPIFAWL